MKLIVNSLLVSLIKYKFWICSVSTKIFKNRTRRKYKIERINKKFISQCMTALHVMILHAFTYNDLFFTC